MKVLITDPISSLGLDILKNNNIKIIYEPNTNTDNIKKLVIGIDAWIIRSSTKITKDLIDRSNILKVIGRAGVGIDNIDINAATFKGIVVINTPDGNTISAAEHTMAMMSSLCRNIHYGHLGIINGEWNRNNLIGSELRGKTLGIVGLGRLGREVAKRALSYDMKILGYDPYVNKELFDNINISITDIDKLTAISDIITLHIPLSETSMNLFNSKRLKLMKPSAKIINVARGGLIDEDALAYALNNDLISGAAIDVFKNEPLEKDHPLIHAKNVLLTPHLGASTEEAKDSVAIDICQQIVDYLKGGQLKNALNMPISDLSLLNKLKPYLKLSHILGNIQMQLSSAPIKRIHIDSYGDIDNTKTISLAFIKGLLEGIYDSRINFINAQIVAKERGISISYNHGSSKTSYSNLIISHIETDDSLTKISGTVFSDNHFRIVDIMGYKIDFKPEGNMLFIKNIDVPGVIGKVGSFLGKSNVNIGEYILSRTNNNQSAFAVVKLDNILDDELLLRLKNFKEIKKVDQLYINNIGMEY